jgi:DNA-nicking Smr family endonuclease
VQALGGGSPELRPLAAARDDGAEDLTEAGEPDGEPVRVPIEDALDLHAFTPRDVASVVEEYLAAARERGFREVRLIHGRGIGVQRSIVHALLSRHPLVSSFADAPPEHGGWGATVVRLR